MWTAYIILHTIQYQGYPLQLLSMTYFQQNSCQTYATIQLLYMHTCVLHDTCCPLTVVGESVVIGLLTLSSPTGGVLSGSLVREGTFSLEVCRMRIGLGVVRNNCALQRGREGGREREREKGDKEVRGERERGRESRE